MNELIQVRRAVISDLFSNVPDVHSEILLLFFKKKMPLGSFISYQYNEGLALRVAGRDDAAK
eukprot:COSAG02_NODE_5_length_66751_cov_63.939148_62_plen_62_part_00